MVGVDRFVAYGQGALMHGPSLPHQKSRKKPNSILPEARTMSSYAKRLKFQFFSDGISSRKVTRLPPSPYWGQDKMSILKVSPGLFVNLCHCCHHTSTSLMSPPTPVSQTFECSDTVFSSLWSRCQVQCLV